MDNVQKTEKSDLELANEALVELKPNITSSDRREAPVSMNTVVQYLKGEGQDLDTAFKLLEYFKGRIDNRRKIIGIETQS